MAKQLLARRVTPGYDVPRIPQPSSEPTINHAAIEASRLRMELGIQQAIAAHRVTILSGGTEYVRQLEMAAESHQAIELILRLDLVGGKTHNMHLQMYVSLPKAHHGTFEACFSSRPGHGAASIKVDFTDYCARNQRPVLRPAPLVS